MLIQIAGIFLQRKGHTGDLGFARYSVQRMAAAASFAEASASSPSIFRGRRRVPAETFFGMMTEPGFDQEHVIDFLSSRIAPAEDARARRWLVTRRVRRALDSRLRGFQDVDHALCGSREPDRFPFHWPLRAGRSFRPSRAARMFFSRSMPPSTSSVAKHGCKARNEVPGFALAMAHARFQAFLVLAICAARGMHPFAIVAACRLRSMASQVPIPIAEAAQRPCDGKEFFLIGENHFLMAGNAQAEMIVEARTASRS